MAVKLKLAKQVLKDKGATSRKTKRELKHERDELSQAVKELAKEGNRPASKSVKRELEGILSRVNKAHGQDSIFLASRMNTDIRKVTTGIVGLDIALLGGLALARISEKAGKFGSTKTTSDYKTHAAFQNIIYPDNGVSLVVNTEKEADSTHMVFNGMNLDRTLIALPDFGDDAGDLSAEVIQEIYESEVLKLFLSIDSVATLFPKVVQGNSLEKTNMGKTPSLITRLVAKILTCMKVDFEGTDPKSTVSLLNQVRIDIGQMFGDPEIIPGGEGKKHWCSQIIKLKKASSIGDKVEVGKGKDKYTWAEAVATKGRFQIIKNKCRGFQNATGEFHYFTKPLNGYRGGEFDNADQLFNLSQAFKLIDVKINTRGVGEIVLHDGSTASSAKAVVEKLKSDPGFYSSMYTALLAKRYDDFWNRGGEGAYGELIEEDDGYEEDLFRTNEDENA